MIINPTIINYMPIKNTIYKGKGKPYGEIYLIRINNSKSSLHNKLYIGQHKGDIFKDNYYGSSSILEQYIKKYGNYGIERYIIAYACTAKELNELEAQYVTIDVIKDNNFLNMKTGGNVNINYSCILRKKHSNRMKQQWSDPEYRKEQSKRAKQQWSDPKYCEEQSKKIKQTLSDPKERNKRSKRAKQHWSDPKYREEQSKKMKQQWSDPEYRKEQSKRVKQQWSDPKYREEHIEGMKRRKSYTNGEKVIYIKSGDPIPEGFIEAKNIKYCTNGKEIIIIKPGDPIPEGFIEYKRNSPIKGRIRYTNGKKIKYIKPGDPVPEGFTLDINKTYAPIKGRICYINGKKRKYIKPGDPIPEGFTRVKKD